MTHQRKRRIEEETARSAQMEMTPMIDVTFLLLIFFMCTIKFKTLEGKLAAYLPSDRGTSSAQVEPIESIEIRIDVVNAGTKCSPTPSGAPGAPWKGAGRFVYGHDRELRYQVGPQSMESIAAVGRSLDAMHARAPEAPVTIDARRGVSYEEVVRLLDETLRAGFTEISFAGSYER